MKPTEADQALLRAIQGIVTAAEMDKERPDLAPFKPKMLRLAERGWLTVTPTASAHLYELSPKARRFLAGDAKQGEVARPRQDDWRKGDPFTGVQWTPARIGATDHERVKSRGM
jgi:hypothetical protein